jgi:hypothetical protein
VLYGTNNKKRKRDEVEGLDDDPNTKRKMRRLENKIINDGEDDDEDNTYEFGQK